MAGKNLFNSVLIKKPGRNHFDLSHDVKMSLDMGVLIPVCCVDTMPGDSFTIGCESFLRFAPMVAPVMHRYDVYVHYFFCPNRLVWKNFENWITGDNTTPFIHPFITVNNIGWTRLCDYLGMPQPPGSNGLKINALPFAVYHKIYNEYYRDQNLITEVPTDLSDGDNDLTIKSEIIGLRRRAWEHDYFTAALPFAQKGASVNIPLGNIGDIPIYRADAGSNTGTAQWTSSGGTNAYTRAQNNPKANHPTISPDHLYGDTTNAVPEGTITDLRRAFKLQEWLEKNARAGTRYIESILAHFGVRSDDARLQRPEYITGSKTPVVISEVLNTSGEISGLPQGNMAGHGVAVTSGKYGKYFCKEHGFIMGIMSVMPKTAYQQGIPKFFLKDDMLEYPWPEFANIGEQPVINNELFIRTDGTGGDTFGYVPRYSEYKFCNNRVAGDFRDSLDYWHHGRVFATPPSLNKAFIECDPGKRIFAVDDPAVHSLYCHHLNKISAIRPLPKYGDPHF